MLDFDKSRRVGLSVLPSYRDQARFHSMYQNYKEVREMKKMSNVVEDWKKKKKIIKIFLKKLF